MNPDAVLLIPYSSGTTGLPKGAQLTHRNIIAQIISYGCLGYPIFDSNDVCLCGASLMHVGSFSTLFSYLGHGSKLILADIIDADAILSTIEKYKPTMMGLYPALLLKLDQHPLLENFDTSSLRNLTYGGCVLNTAVLKSITRKLGLKTISQVYGMTELSSCIASTIPLLDEKMCVGKPLPFTQVKVADLNTRKALGPYQRGEVCVKNPCTFKGYLNKPKETADAYEEGFVRTGDMGYYSDDGSIFLCGRLKELIKCMDKQVAPAEIEEVLATDPEVRCVAVAGIPHPKYGEAARAFVVPKRRPAGPVEEQKETDRLKDLVAAHLSFHKRLHGGVEFLEGIPQTEIGKHPRTSLREAYMQRQKNVTGNQGGLKRDEVFIPHY